MVGLVLRLWLRLFCLRVARNQLSSLEICHFSASWVLESQHHAFKRAWLLDWGWASWLNGVVIQRSVNHRLVFSYHWNFSLVLDFSFSSVSFLRFVLTYWCVRSKRISLILIDGINNCDVVCHVSSRENGINWISCCVCSLGWFRRCLNISGVRLSEDIVPPWSDSGASELYSWSLAPRHHRYYCRYNERSHLLQSNL